MGVVGLTVPTYYYVNEIYQYDSENNNWRLTTTLSERQGAIVVIYNGKLYIGLGCRHYYSSTNYFLEYSF